jgi:hypothetical protein
VPYRIAPPGDAAAVASALDELTSEILTGPDMITRTELHRFSREAIAGRLATLLDRCASGGRLSAGQGGGGDSDTVELKPERGKVLT